MKNFSILSIFLFSLCVSLSQAEEEPAAAVGAGDDLSERRLLMAKANHRALSHVSQQSVYSSPSHFQAPQPSPYNYMQSNYAYQPQYPHPQMPVPSMSSYLQQYQQYQQPQHMGYPPYSGYGLNGLSGVSGLSGLSGMSGLNAYNAYPGYVRNSVKRAYNTPLGCPVPTPAVSVGGFSVKPKYSFPGSYGFAVPSPDYGVIPNVLSGLASGASFRSNTGVDNDVAEEN